MSSHAPSFFKRYFFSTNHKDIGVLYLYFAVILVYRGIFSLLIRMELAERYAILEMIIKNTMFGYFSRSINDFLYDNATMVGGFETLVPLLIEPPDSFSKDE